jgi:arylsulfatase A-like enzyme
MNNLSSTSRRDFIQQTGALAATAAAGNALAAPGDGKLNVLYVFSDQWRTCDHGYMGNTDVVTPNIDRLAGESINMVNAVSGIPVCCPHRASLITGQYPLTHGLYLNDLNLRQNPNSMGHCFRKAGYETGWIGKWHIDGRGRGEYTPPERRQGFEFWRALECTHNYNKSVYYADSPEKKVWEGYDAIDQTRVAEDYLKQRAEDKKPFSLFLSWGPPHAPYHTAPKAYMNKFDPGDLSLRDNVPKEREKTARKLYHGYYAHMAALDKCLGDLMATLKATGLDKNTILVYTSDHGDMLQSHGFMKKQQPWEESLRVPFLLRHPNPAVTARSLTTLIDTPDIMPTLLSMCNVSIPAGVQGSDMSAVMTGKKKPNSERAALMTCPQPFAQWGRHVGGREYRGVRTERHSYVKSLEGPWLLYDNEDDPYQLRNLTGKPEAKSIQDDLEQRLRQMLKDTGDTFLPGPELIKRSGYVINPRNGTVDYGKPFNPVNVTKSPI